MSMWPQRTISEVAEKVAMGPFGSSIKVSTFVPDGVPVISGQHLNEAKVTDGDFNFITEEHASRLANANVQPGDVIFTHAGNIGQVAYIGPTAAYDRYVISQRQFYMRCDLDHVLPEYVTYYFRSPQGQHQLLANRSSTGVPSIARPVTYLRTIRVPVPPLDEQRAIAAVLGALDDKIEQNQRTARVLERLARAIFRAWFVDFEPVKVKAAGAVGFPSMPQEIFDALPTRFINSEIGPVPEGWEVGKLIDYCSINEQSVRKGDIDGEIEYVDISSVTVGHLDAVQRVRFDRAPSRARRRVRHGDTIWSCVRPNRRSYAFIHTPPSNRIVSTGFAVLSPAAFGSSYLYQTTTQPEFVDYLVANAEGSAYPAVRPDHFGAATVVIPPGPLRNVFDALTMPLRNVIEATDRESRKLAETRDYLLPKLLSGEVRVSPNAVDPEEPA